MPSSLVLVSLEGLPYRIGHQCVRPSHLLNLLVNQRLFAFLMMCKYKNILMGGGPKLPTKAFRWKLPIPPARHPLHS